MTTRLNRIDRFPFLLHRWNGAISICIVLSESEVNELDEKLRPFLNRGIVFTFYIAKEYPDHQYHGYYIRDKEKGIVRNFTTMIYPVNLARDLAIESISTTHYLFIDCDFFTSDTIYSNIRSFASVLSKPKTVLLIPTFQVNKKILKKCRDMDTCELLYSINIYC